MSKAEVQTRWPDSLWKATAPDQPASPVLSGDHTADVTVIGAGFTGLRAALCLAEAGSDVVVLDSGDIGWGASGRNGGQINPMLAGITPAELQSRVGARFFDRMAEASLRSADELFDLIEAYQIECHARRNGWLRANHCEKAMREAWEAACNWNEAGADMRLVEGQEMARMTGTDVYRSGIITPAGGALHPLMLAHGEARAARDRGARIFGQSPATALTFGEKQWRVSTPQGSVTSEWVIVATNAYSGDLLPGLAQSILPVAPIQIATDPLPAEQVGSILPGGNTISDTRRVVAYARREPDGRMAYGGLGRVRRDGRIVGYDALIRDAERVFPQLRGAEWKYRWGGEVAVTDDHLPHLHEPRKGLLAGLGYNGRGVALSHVMGRVMAERVLGAAPDDLAFPVSAISRVPYRGAKMLGKSTAVWWMRILDYLETR